MPHAAKGDAEMLSRRLPEVAQAAHPRENAPCARRSRSNAAGRARTRTTRYARGSPRTRARGTHPTRAHTRARPTLGARAHARLTRATRTHTRAHTHTRARATSVDPRLRPCGAWWRRHSGARHVRGEEPLHTPLGAPRKPGAGRVGSSRCRLSAVAVGPSLGVCSS